MAGFIDRTFLILIKFWVFFAHIRLIKHALKKTKKIPDPVTPKTTVDKFLWRKIFDHNPLFVIACDKIEAKKYAISKVPELRTAKIKWVGKDARSIPPEVLTENVIIKSNQGSGWHQIIMHGKENLTELYQNTDYWLSHLYGKKRGEWGYSLVKRQLLVEEMLLTDGVPVSEEYKFHICSGQTVYVLEIQSNSNMPTKKVVLNRSGYAVDSLLPRIISLDDFERMRDLAEKLAEPFDFIRCDFYLINSHVFFSELTVYPSSGFGTIENTTLRELRNKKWDIRKSWFLSTKQKGWRHYYSSALLRWLNRNTT